LPEGASWVADYVASLGAFPNATHDDDVDSTTQALSYLSNNPDLSTFINDDILNRIRSMGRRR
jgi:phage terminase large subunit-like protein